MSSVRRALLSALLVAALATPALATTVRVANLQDLVEQSGSIFVGKVLDRGQDEQNGIPFTHYTLEVTDSIMGVKQTTITVRQFGLLEPMAAANGMTRMSKIDGMPTYEVGEEFLLFLVKESPIGLRSPVGLTQGAFKVVSKDDHKVLINGARNINIFRNLNPQWLLDRGVSPQKLDILREQKGGDLAYDEFVDMVRTIVEVARR